jgi:hypothetical protein
VHAILNRCFVLFDSLCPGADETWFKEVFELFEVEYGVKSPHRWIVDLMLKSGFEGLEYGCRNTFGAN